MDQLGIWRNLVKTFGNNPLNTRMVESVQGLLGGTPIVGDVQSGLLAANDISKGNYGDAALNGIGLLPFVPSMAGITAYHATPNFFKNFDSKFLGSTTDAGELGRGFYSSTDEAIGRNAKHLMKIDADVANPVQLSYPSWGADKRKLLAEHLKINSDATPEEITNTLKMLGHDGVMLDYSPVGYNHKEIMAIDPKQMKYESHLK